MPVRGRGLAITRSISRRVRCPIAPPLRVDSTVPGSPGPLGSRCPLFCSARCCCSEFLFRCATPTAEPRCIARVLWRRRRWPRWPRRFRFSCGHQPRSRVALYETDRALRTLRARAPDSRCTLVFLVLDYGIFVRALPTLLPREPAVPVDPVIPAAGLLAHRLTCVAIGDAGSGRRTGGAFCAIGNAHFLLAVTRHRRSLHRFGAQQNESNDGGHRVDKFACHPCCCPLRLRAQVRRPAHNNRSLDDCTARNKPQV